MARRDTYLIYNAVASAAIAASTAFEAGLVEPELINDPTFIDDFCRGMESVSIGQLESLQILVGEALSRKWNEEV